MQLVTLKVLSPVSSIWQISLIYSNSIYMVNFIPVLSYANGFVSSMVSSMQSISLEQWVSLCWFNLIHMVISFLVVIHFTQVKIFFLSNFSIFNPYGPMSLMWWVLFTWFNFICIIKFTFVLNFPLSMRHAQGHGNRGKRGKENNKNVHCSSTMGMLKSWGFLVAYL